MDDSVYADAPDVAFLQDDLGSVTADPFHGCIKACHEISGSIACAWGRRSVFVACPARSGWQATENDGLPHECSTYFMTSHYRPAQISLRSSSKPPTRPSPPSLRSPLPI